MNVAWATIRELRKALDGGIISEGEILDHLLTRFKQYDAAIGSALELFDADSIKARPRGIGRLSGIPGVIKDAICMKNRRMSCASRMLEHYIAPYDATVITKLEANGALLVGRGNMDEFSMGSSSETSAYYPVKNPWNTAAVPGGSGGGPAAAVAAGFVPWALGTETGGSVRQPAAWCGIVGSKPTYGLVSRYGVTAYASSLDQVGVCTRTVYDNALVLSCIAGREEPVRDGTARLLPPDYDLTTTLDGTLPEGLTIGIIEDGTHAALSDEVRRGIEGVIHHYEKMGARMQKIALPSMQLGAATYFVISRAEAASNLARFDGVRYGHRSVGVQELNDLYTLSRSEGFGDEVKRRILIGNYTLSHGYADQFYQKAVATQALMRAELHDVLQSVDLILAPVSPITAPALGEMSVASLELDLQDYFTCFANLAGIPAVAFPCGFSETGMPLSVQLMGPAWSEALLMRAAYAYEQTTEWHLQHPQLGGNG